MKYLICMMFCAIALSASAQQVQKTNVKSNSIKPAFWVIDGTKMDSTTMAKKPLDPNNIESISVWKGDSAVVRFGEEGRNGVIIVVTKSAATQNRKKQP